METDGERERERERDGVFYLPLPLPKLTLEEVVLLADLDAGLAVGAFLSALRKLHTPVPCRVLVCPTAYRAPSNAVFMVQKILMQSQSSSHVSHRLIVGGGMRQGAFYDFDLFFPTSNFLSQHDNASEGCAARACGGCGVGEGVRAYVSEPLFPYRHGYWWWREVREGGKRMDESCGAFVLRAWIMTSEGESAGDRTRPPQKNE